MVGFLICPVVLLIIWKTRDEREKNGIVHAMTVSGIFNFVVIR